MRRRIRNAPSVEVNNEKCTACGSEDYKEIFVSDVVDFRSIELDVDNLKKSICGKCGIIFETASQEKKNSEFIRSAYLVERDRLRLRDGLLSSEEIEKIRNSFGLLQRDAAALFGGGPNAFNKYESGEVLQSIPMDRLLRLARAVGPQSVHILKSVVEHHALILSGTDTEIPAQVEITLGKRIFTITNPVNTYKIAAVISSTLFEKEKTPTLVNELQEHDALKLYASPRIDHKKEMYSEITERNPLWQS